MALVIAEPVCDSAVSAEKKPNNTTASVNAITGDGLLRLVGMVQFKLVNQIYSKVFFQTVEQPRTVSAGADRRNGGRRYVERYDQGSLNVMRHAILGVDFVKFRNKC